MNIEKFSDRAKGFLQSAQTVAIRNNHQRVAPEHVLKALLEDEQGHASGLIKAAGGTPATALQLTDQALAKIAQVSGQRCAIASLGQRHGARARFRRTGGGEGW